MAEPIKNLLNKSVIKDMAGHFQRQWSSFDKKGFIAAATKNLHSLGINERTTQISNAMTVYLPTNFKQAGKIILAALGPPLDEAFSIKKRTQSGITGWAVMPLSQYVGMHGYQHFDYSMSLFKELTKRESAEFGIRLFLLRAPKRTLAVMKKWCRDSNPHIRRLASEGARPRLPWAKQLPEFIKNPEPVIKLLECLKDDTSEFVRKSVANNLNDISKEHPNLVSNIAKQWLKDADKNRVRLIRHACRTLIKNGHKNTLKVLGYVPAKIRPAYLTILTPAVKFGKAVHFTLALHSDADHDQRLMIDYIIHHQKANGKTSPKVFKWRSVILHARQSLDSSKQHTIKKITTRTYYPGKHCVEVIVNGVSVGAASFELKIPRSYNC